MEERKRFLPEQRDIHDFLEKKTDHAFQGKFAAQTILFEAQSVLDRSEWLMRNDDIALYETGMRPQSQRMELHQANQLTDQIRREKSWLCDELETRNRAFKEERARNSEEIEKLLRIYLAEAERARQLKYDELSTQKEENPSTVYPLMVQIQELQDKVSSLSGAKEFFDPETASTSGLSHVPRNSLDTSGHVF